ncbi:hypothetical protein SAMN05720472_2666 [Fibrobacter sp. UWR3]|uniref:hypothetical protein n=1 Tax=Fibrobacter sp. UWR3 TaxID=1896217 RepID=UPI0009218AD5|nr:hypothetical protein [Fibrobacter sp. UWR3]SHM92235.1 hypothetical protein SAMN05720472_2666 [Fibrobacter sp. UWR3]
MSTSLPKLQILLNDMLVNARAKRTQQNLNMSFGEKDYITLLDVKARFSEIWNDRNLFMTIDELNKENVGDFLMKNAIFYFFMRTIQIKDSEFFKLESNQLKELIFKTIVYIHSNALMDESLKREREYFDNEISEGNKPEIEAFYQLLEAKMPKEEYYDYALGFYVASASKYMEKKNPYWYLNFKSIIDYVGNARNPEKFSGLVNEIIVKYFYIFCDLQTIDKKFMHTELNLIERRISNQDYTHKVLLAWNIQDIYNMVCIDCLVRDDVKQNIFEELMAKVFYNEYSISYSLQSNRTAVKEANEFWKSNLFKDKILKNDIIGFSRDDYYTTPYQLFNAVFYVFKEDFNQNPGIIACLYLLSTEMDADSFFSFFSLEKEDEKDGKLTNHYLRKIDDTLKQESIINHNLEIRGERGKNYRRYHDIFSGYKDAIKKGKTEECLKLQQEKQDLELGVNRNFDLKRDLLQRFLWFTIVFKCGLFYDNDEDVYKINSDRDKMLIPFCNGMIGNEYANIKYVNVNFNSILKKIGVENEIDLFIDKVKDYRSIVLLVYNLSRAEFNSREFLINEINSIREIQKEKLHVDLKDVPRGEKFQAKAEEIKEYNKVSKRNLEKLKKIDCGFKLNSFSQSFYPFSASSFHSKEIWLKGNKQGLFSFGFEHRVDCKLIWETDNEYSDGELNWRVINERGLTTRYLYRDRNSYTHHSEHSSVNALMEPKNWANLLRALSYYYLLLRCRFWSERICLREGYNIQEDDTFFQNLFLQSEVEDIYNILVSLVQECAGVIISKPPVIFDAEKYNKTQGKDASTVDDLLSYIQEHGSKKSEISYSEIPERLDPNYELFEMRLERLLKIMFMVNDFDPVDQKHSVKFMDFYSQYNTEISIYLIYMAFAMNYCDDVKADSL